MAENQYDKLSIGKIELEDNMKATSITTPIYGKIEKIIVKYGEGADPEMKLKITTSDGEVLVNAQTNRSNIYYPRNWNTAAQSYMGINEAGQEASTSERYLSYGRIYVFVEGASKEDSIKDIQIIIEGKVEHNDDQYLTDEKVEKKVNEIMKATMSSTDNATSNTSFNRRENKVRKYIELTLSDILKEENMDLPIEKQTIGLDQMVKFISTSFFAKAFEGLSKAKSNDLREVMINMLIKGEPLTKIIDLVNRKTGKKIDPARAEMIARTETQALQNAAREFSYKKVDPNGEWKYSWLNPLDNRTSSICKNIVERTKQRVSLDELRKIVKEESIKGGFDGSREWTPHIYCRSSFFKKFD